MARALAIAVVGLLTLRAAAIPPPPPADLSVTASFDRPAIETGTRAALRFTITNLGPYGGSPMNATIRTTALALLPASGQAWSCTPRADGTAQCTIDWNLPVGGTVAIEVPVIAGSGASASADVFVDYRGSSADGDRTNNRATPVVALVPTARQIDLSVAVDDDPPAPVPFGSSARRLVVANDGPRVAHDVIVYVTESPDFTATAGSPDWQCTRGALIACTYGRPIGAGRNVELLLEITPPFTGPYSASVSVAGSGGDEKDSRDNTAVFHFASGVASDFAPVLVPDLAWNAPGQMNTLWSNELAVHTTKPGVPLHGAPCAGSIVLTDVITLWPGANCPAHSQGVLLYVPKAHRDVVTFSSHLFEHDLLAAELPVVDGSRFKTRIFLPRVDLRRLGSARLTLRVYSIDAEPDHRVSMDTWPPMFSHPPLPDPPLQNVFVRMSEERNELGLPVHPAFAEFGDADLRRKLPTTFGPVTIVVASSRPIWAMLVVVDNATQRPVFLTPQ